MKEKTQMRVKSSHSGSQDRNSAWWDLKECADPLLIGSLADTLATWSSFVSLTDLPGLPSSSATSEISLLTAQGSCTL